MIHLVCLTKSYNYNDFKLWYNWHCKLGIDYIHILNNESNVPICNCLDLNREDTIENIIGWPNQWQLFSDILNKNLYNFKENDLIMFFDDDEFLWIDMSSPLEELLQKQFKMLECVMIPQILMSTKNILEQRSTDLIQQSIYRRNDISNQGKCILMYNPTANYDFTKEEQNERGHIPFINNMRYSDVVGSDCSKTTYGLVKYDAPVRLYHYHIKSIDDWKHKLERGSAANRQQFYNEDITKNKWYGNYTIPDLSMQNLKNRLIF